MTARQARTRRFRSGAIEGVETYLLGRREGVIPSTSFEQVLIEALCRYLSLANDIGAAPPYLVALTMLGVRGLRMAVSQRYIDQPEPIDRDDLVLPEALVEGLPVEPQTVLRPLLDAVWNASGWPRSPNYNDEGEWHEPERG